MSTPYDEATPYEVLDLDPQATAVEIRDRHNKLQRDLQESSLTTNERSRRKQQLEAAYNQLRVAAQRVRVDFWLLDPRIGLKQCESLAEDLAVPETNVEGLVKPRTIRVTHVAVLGELKRYLQEPERVVGLHPQPVELGATPRVPAALQVQFDC